ncbi:MAG: hypothetical protein AB4352_04605 [Hormoscilla sp.]
MDDLNKQLSIFQQPIEVLVENACTLERAVELVKCSEELICKHIDQKKRFESQAATVKWRVYPATKEQVYQVTFVYSPAKKVWRVAD